MDEKTTYWASVVLGAVALLLLVINISLINGNRHLQEEVGDRQSLINGGTNLSQLNKGLVQALADISVKNSDAEARDLLAAQGITIGAKGEEQSAKKKVSETKTPESKSSDAKEP
jgi:hypothetical protein